MPRASRVDVERQYRAIESIVAAQVEGIDAASILSMAGESLGRPIDRRVLNRWLESLVASGRILRKGAGRQTRYHPGIVGVSADPENAAGGADQPTLTAMSHELIALLRREKGTRPAMPYRDHVIRDYIPSQTWHLSSALRTRLRETGRTPDAASPPGTFAQRHFDRLLLDLTCGSVALELESPSYSRLEVQQLLEGGAIDASKSATEAQLIFNHKRAIELLVDRESPLALDAGSLCNLHAALSDNLLSDIPDEGRLRTRGAVLAESSLVPIGDAGALAGMFDLLLERVAAIPDPFEQAFFVLLQIPYLHPFVALNDAVARLAVNIPLLRANLSPMTWEGVPRSFYREGVLGYFEYQKSYALRDVFAWGYERSCARFGAGVVQAVSPDPIRLRYRRALHAVVREAVVERVVPDESWLARWAELQGVAADDLAAFVAQALALLSALHEGALWRYGITREEFEGWQSIGGGESHD